MSLFDGIGCGRLAMDRADIYCSQYFASEIDNDAIRVAVTNHTNIIPIGDVQGIDPLHYDEIDILMGGSPCQGFSYSGKMLNFDDPRSKLFFEFVRLLKELKPKYFILENVVMKKAFEEVITEHLGVEPVLIDSNLVSAQNRKRLYWSNFPITQPEDKGVDLVDVLDDKSMINPAAIRGRSVGRDDGKSQYTQCLEVRKKLRNKSNCLTTVEKDNVLTSMPVGRHPNLVPDNLPYRHYTLKEYCRLQTIPEDYFEDIVSESKAKKMVGNGWTVDVIAHIFECMKRDIDKCVY